MRRPNVRKNPLLTRYWIEFSHELTPHSGPWLPATVGVTAYSFEDALDIVHQYLYEFVRMPREQQPHRRVFQITEGVDISTLRDKHGRPIGAGIPIWRGIWYPNIWYWAWRLPQS